MSLEEAENMDEDAENIKEVIKKVKTQEMKSGRKSREPKISIRAYSHFAPINRTPAIRHCGISCFVFHLIRIPQFRLPRMPPVRFHFLFSLIECHLFLLIRYFFIERLPHQVVREED
ncbi:hypothetical protein KFK09_019539 [Dendrobium nobile]|uniref:Uncharacterized protein n=1 Tax=Dendrobium nobile TaxID=94219 RepID=A0A8T3AQK1_DENNO|nr:hypothetical protein KFK09_019539 [Dendrobium nobile]